MTNNVKNMSEAVVSKAENLAGTVKDKAYELRDKASELGENLSEKASTAMHTASDKASSAMHTVSDKASVAMGTVTDKANSAMTSMGESMTGLAETLREKAPVAVAPYARRAAASLEQAGTYLEQGTIGDMVDDITGLVHRHPLLVLVTGLGLGYMLSRRRDR